MFSNCSRKLIGQGYQCNRNHRKQSMTVSDNTIPAKRLGDSNKQLGKTALRDASNQKWCSYQ